MNIDYIDLLTKAELLRKQLGEDNYSPIDIFALAQEIEGLTVVYYPFSNKISGMCIKGNDGRCVIALNSLMTLGRQHFSLAHELYHLFYDDNMSSICAKPIGLGNLIEKEADFFAANFLMPRSALINKTNTLISKHNDKITLKDIIYIEQFFKVSHQSAVFQLINCGYISKENADTFLNVNIRKEAESIGFSSDLYLPSPKINQYRTYGNYINQANELLKKEIISQGKYEELLLDAFREDLVYGFDEGGEFVD